MLLDRNKMKYFKFLKKLADEALKYPATTVKDMKVVAKSIADTTPPNSSLQKLMDTPTNYKSITSGAFKETFFGSLSMKKFLDYIKIGKVEDAFKKSINKRLSLVESNALKLEVSRCPAARIYNIEETTATAAKTSLGSKVLKAKDVNELDEIVKNDKKLSNFFTKNKGKTVGYLALTTVAAVTAGTLIDNHRKKMTRCLRYKYNDDGSTTVCVVKQQTCTSVGDDEVGCTAAVYTEDGISIQSCVNEPSGCINCDSRNDAPEILDPTVVYRCVQATFLDALTDMAGDAANGIFNAITGTMFEMLKIILLYFLLPVGVVAVIIWLFTYLKSKYSSASPRYDQLVTDKT